MFPASAHQFSGRGNTGMKRNQLIFHVTLVLVFAVALLLVVVLLVGSEEAESWDGVSNVGLYMKDPGDLQVRAVRAYEDDTIQFNLSLVNYEEHDLAERTVLLCVVPDVRDGDEENWDYEFLDAVWGGLPVFTGEHPNFGVVDFYKYHVDGNGTPTNVTFEVAHDYEIPPDNHDTIDYRIYGLDYEVDDEPTVPYPNMTLPESLERFWTKIIQRDWNHNITYLLEDGEVPNTNHSNAQELRVFVVPNPLDPNIYVHPSIAVSAGSAYKLLLTVMNEGAQEDQLQFFAELVGDTKGHWDIQAEDYVFGGSSRFAVWETGGRSISTSTLPLTGRTCPKATTHSKCGRYQRPTPCSITPQR